MDIEPKNDPAQTTVTITDPATGETRELTPDEVEQARGQIDEQTTANLCEGVRDCVYDTARAMIDFGRYEQRRGFVGCAMTIEVANDGDLVVAIEDRTAPGTSHPLEDDVTPPPAVDRVACLMALEAAADVVRYAWAQLLKKLGPAHNPFQASIHAITLQSMVGGILDATARTLVTVSGYSGALGLAIQGHLRDAYSPPGDMPMSGSERAELREHVQAAWQGWDIVGPRCDGETWRMRVIGDPEATPRPDRIQDYLDASRGLDDFGCVTFECEALTERELYLGTIELAGARSFQ